MACVPGRTACDSMARKAFIAVVETCSVTSASAVSRSGQVAPKIHAERYRWSRRPHGRKPGVPAAGQPPLLPDAAFISEPDLDALRFGVRPGDLAAGLGEVFLKA